MFVKRTQFAPFVLLLPVYLLMQINNQCLLDETVFLESARGSPLESASDSLGHHSVAMKGSVLHSWMLWAPLHGLVLVIFVRWAKMSWSNSILWLRAQWKKVHVETVESFWRPAVGCQMEPPTPGSRSTSYAQHTWAVGWSLHKFHLINVCFAGPRSAASERKQKACLKL